MIGQYKSNRLPPEPQTIALCLSPSQAASPPCLGFGCLAVLLSTTTAGSSSLLSELNNDPENWRGTAALRAVSHLAGPFVRDFGPFRDYGDELNRG